MKSAYFIIYLLFLTVSHQLFSQPEPSNDAGKLDDLSRININIFIPDDSLLMDEELSAAEYEFMKNTLSNKLRSFVARHGFSGTDRSPRFMLFPTLTLLNSTPTSSAPTMYIIQMEISLYVADYLDQKTFDVEAFNIQGAGNNREQAIRKALTSMKYTQQMQTFLDDSKQNILAYYNDQCDFIMQEAEMLSNTHRYETAFNLLLQIPQASKHCYQEAMVRIPEYYKRWDRRRCHEQLQKAKTAWAGKSKSHVLDRAHSAEVGVEKDKIAEKFEKGNDPPAKSGVNTSMNATETNKFIYEALQYLDKIYPDSECYEEANALLEEIKVYVDNEQFFENRKKYEDARELESLRFKAVSDMANAALQMDMLEMRERQRTAAIQIIK